MSEQDRIVWGLIIGALASLLVLTPLAIAMCLNAIAEIKRDVAQLKVHQANKYTADREDHQCTG